MSSQRKLQASRSNGALARGRKTPAGIARSAQNAFRHGLLARCLLLDGESPETFQQLLDQFVARFHPAGGVEDGLIEEMVSAFWRTRRAWAIENQLLNAAIRLQPPADPLHRLADAF